jgi:hypothetical protein
VKYLTFPADNLGPAYTVCQECIIPTLKAVVAFMGGEVAADDFDELVVQMDEGQMRINGHQDPMRPEIVDEAPGLVCAKCEREGVAA